MNEYKPTPLDTSKVKLPEDILELAELLATNTHDNWAQGRMNQGWTWGPERNDQKKETPCMVSYPNLPESEKEYDRVTALETLKAIYLLGYRIDKDDSEVTL